MQYIQYIYNWFRRCSNTNPSSSVFVFQKKMGENLLNRLYDNFGSKFSSINAGNGQHHIRPISSLIQVRGFTQYGNLQKNQPTCKRKSNQPAFLSTRNEKPPPGSLITTPLNDVWEKKQDPLKNYTYIRIWSDMYVYIISSIHVCICNIPIFVQKAFAALCMSGALHNKKMVYIEFICI